jgi:hypothetical protein
MEVHHHSHTARKKWTHYFWEFLMLFLAVFCGFLAEYQLEHKIEKNREKQFINSIAKDLKQDIHTLDSLIKGRQYRMVMLDSLVLLLKTANPDEHGNKLYYYARWLTYTLRFINNDRTIQQLKNGGNLRLISNQAVSDQIMDYDQQVRWIIIGEQREESFIFDYIECLQELFNTGEFDRMLDKESGFSMPTDNPPLLTKEKSKLHKIQSIIHFLKAVNIYLLTWNIKQEKRAHATLNLIRKEYHIVKE